MDRWAGPADPLDNPQPVCEKGQTPSVPGALLDSNVHEGGRDPRAIPVVLRGAGICACPRRRSCRPCLRPVRAAHHRRHAAVQALLPRRGGAAHAPADLLPEVLPHHRHRGRRHRPRATSPSSRCSATSRSATTSRRARSSSRWELSTQGFGLRPRARSGSRSSAATRSSGSGPTRRRSSAGARSACPTSGSCCSAARTTSGSPGRPARAAPARSSTSTAASTSAATTTGPGDDTERFLEFWNLVFMQYELHADGSLTELPTKNIDTGLGLERMAAILQDVPSVFETDQFRPLVELGEELSGRAYGQDDPRPPARCGVLADHGRGGDLPARRRRRARRTRTAATSCAGSCAARCSRATCSASSGPFLPRLAERVDRGDGRRLPRAAARAADDRALGARRGGELRPHARAGRAACWPS